MMGTVLLSSFAERNEVARDGVFSRLGYFYTPGEALLVFARSRNFLVKALSNPAVSALVVTPELLDEVPDHIGALVSPDPRSRFFEIHESILRENNAPRFEAKKPADAQIHPTSFVHPAAKIGRGVRIGEFAVVRAGVTIGDEVVIEPGAKVGVDGILHRKVNGRTRLIPHGGRTVLGDGVTLMANSVVVSAIFPDDSTSVGEGSLIGMNAVAGHEATVGRNCVVSNGVVLARDSRVGDEAFIGTGSVVREYVSIGQRARIMAGSVVITDVRADESVSGNFATDHSSRLREFLRRSAGKQPPRTVHDRP